jgi:hypothetical protein
LGGPSLPLAGVAPALHGDQSEPKIEALDGEVRQRVTAFPQVVDRGGIDPPTFRFSGGRSSD